MPWNKRDYPVSMKNLKPRVRHKAIEIANALLDEGYDEGRSIAIATAKAEEWDANHPADEHSASDSDRHGHPSGNSRASSGQGHSEPVSSSKNHANIHVVPNDDDGWSIKKEGKAQPLSTYRTKHEALKAAREMSGKQNIRAIIHNRDGQIAASFRA